MIPGLRLFMRSAALCGLLLCGLPAAAQEVTLRATGGGLEITGDLLGFDGRFYRLRTTSGDVSVDGARVDCTGACPPTDAVPAVTFSGAAAIGRDLMPALLDAFAETEGYEVVRRKADALGILHVLSDPRTGEEIARLTFRAHTTSEGFADLLAGEADIVMAGREVNPEEAERARLAGLGDLGAENRSRVVALDALVPVVAPGNELEAISAQQLARVLAGRARSWDRIGGPDAPVAVHLPARGTSVAQDVERRLLSPRGLAPSAEAKRHDAAAALAAAVAGDPLAIGVTRMSDAGSTRVLPLAGPCGLRQAADELGIRTEDYPLTVPMMLYFPARRFPDIVTAFLSFTRTDRAQHVVRHAGYMDLLPREIPLSGMGERLATAIDVAEGKDGLARLKRMVSILSPMSRLTTSFRFEPGAARLDAPSRSNVWQLSRALGAGTYDGRRLVFVGFSDGQGPAAPNRVIARKRAEAVRAAVLAAIGRDSGVSIGIAGFGEAMPIACDATALGRQSNRRVEVWVR